MIAKDEAVKKESDHYGYKSDSYSKPSSSSSWGGSAGVNTEVKSEPRDIDMRKSRRESESYSPTRPDYSSPSIKTEGLFFPGLYR